MKKKITMVLDKFPHLNQVKKNIAEKKQLIAINDKLRKVEIPKMIASSKSNYEKLKFEKELITLDREQGQLYKAIANDENHFKNWKEHLKSYLDKVNTNYDNLVKQARAEILKNKDIKLKFAEFEQFDFENNWEAKVSFYMELEKILYQKDNK